MLINAKFIHIGERRNYETGIAAHKDTNTLWNFPVIQKKSGGWRRVLRSYDEREKERERDIYKIEKEEKKITTKYIWNK